MIFFSNAFRMIFAFLDSILFNFFIMVYNLFYEMIGVNIFDNDMLEKFSSRIYFMLGLFMLLKLSFSFLSYAVNPDNISNKDTGVGKLITNTFVVLILIGTTPFIFSKAMEFQKIIIDDNIIPNIILGVAPEKVSPSFQRNVGSNMAYKVAFSFITPNKAELKELSAACKNPIVPNSENISGSELEPNCYEALLSVSKNTITADIYRSAIKFGDYSGLYDWDVYTGISKNSGDIYVFNYLALVSTLVIGTLILLFIGFTMDVALRMIKLGFLQLMAPVAIISYIDPKSSKNGAFSKWVKACVGTYADLFIRLIAVNFAIFVVGLVSEMQNNVGDNPLIFVFVIIGAFMFAKQLPGLLGDILGIKLGEFNLNPWKKIPKMGQQTLAGIGGAAIGGAGSAISRGTAAFNNKKGNFGQKALSAVGGGLLGGVIGATQNGVSGYKGSGKGLFSNSLSTIGGQYGIQKAQKGTSIGGRLTSALQQRMGMKTEGELMQKRSENLQKHSAITNNLHKLSQNDATVQSAQARLEQFKSDPTKTAADITAAQNDVKAAEAAALNDALTNNANPLHEMVVRLSSQANEILSKNGSNSEFKGIKEINATTIGEVEEQSQKASIANDIFVNSEDYINAQKTDKLAKPQGSK